MAKVSAPDPFEVLLDAAQRVGDPAVATTLLAVRQRVDEGRFFVACVGQFKRGKSTVLNALVGSAILPVGVVPVTAVVTVLRYGSSRQIRVRQRGEDWRSISPGDLACYVTEEQNPGNVKRVEAAEIYEPSPLLASGMCLVDTPGVGSVFVANSAATREFLPHVDAALVVLGADPPISGEELALLEDLAREVNRLVVVINKADRLGPRDIEQARVFTRRVLEDTLGRPAPDVLIVSAAERLDRGPTREWTLLEERLGSLAREAGADLIAGARRRGLDRAIERILNDVAECRSALERPMDESKRRLDLMRRAVDEAETAASHLEYLFRAEEDKMRRSLETRRSAFLVETLPNARRSLVSRLSAISRSDRKLRARSHAIAQEVGRECVAAWLASVQSDAEAMYRCAMDRFIDLANELLQRLRASGDKALASLPPEIGAEAGFRGPAHFFFTDLLHLIPALPGIGVLDAVRSRRATVASTAKRIAPYLDRLIETNSARGTNDLVDRVRESGRLLRAELVSLLRMTTTIAEGALERATAARDAGEQAVRGELERLACVEERVRSVEY